MLMRSDPFREADRLVQQMLGTPVRPAAMPMNAYRQGETFYVEIDLPGIADDSIELTVEQNILTIRAERDPLDSDEDIEVLISECPAGAFTRQVFLGDTLDADQIKADYTAGVLKLTIPIHEAAKPRRVSITSGQQTLTT